MLTILALFCFLGFYCLYNTSGKAKLSEPGTLERWLRSRPGAAKVLGISLMVVSFAGFLWTCGIGVGSFTALLCLMTAATCIVTFAPFGYFKAGHILALLLISIVLELFIF